MYIKYVYIWLYVYIYTRLSGHNAPYTTSHWPWPAHLALENFTELEITPIFTTKTAKLFVETGGFTALPSGKRLQQTNWKDPPCYVAG